jgi:hypothetical protein
MAFTVVNQIHILGCASVIRMGLYRVLYACKSGALHFLFLFLFPWYRAGIKGKKRKTTQRRSLCTVEPSTIGFTRIRLVSDSALCGSLFHQSLWWRAFTLHLKLIIQRTNSTKATNTLTLGMLQVVLHPDLKQWPIFSYRFTSPRRDCTFLEPHDRPNESWEVGSFAT